MNRLEHIAIYISAEENVEHLAELIMQGSHFDFAEGLEKIAGALFSTVAIRQLMNKELLHGHYSVATATGNPLASSSSGEQRRALLDFILLKKPGYIIADNVFESIDEAGQQGIAAKLAEVAAHTFIIQMLYRKSDCLPFINKVLTVKNKVVVKQETRKVFLATDLPMPFFNGTVPAAAPCTYHLYTDVLVEMKNVSVSFEGRRVLNNICWVIKPGEFWHLSGPNGSGKSTLLSLINGDSVKGYGKELYLFGKKKGSGETVWDIKQKIGYFTSVVAQEFSRQDSAEQMIISGFVDSVGLYIQPTDVQVKLAGQWLQMLGLYHLRHKPFRFFTLVQQRMILIARAMVKHPPLLILDEPTAGLDDENALLFTVLANKIVAETSTAILYVSHREEAGLLPHKVFELMASADGSAGVIIDG